MKLAITLLMALTSGVCLADNSSGAGGGGLMLISVPSPLVAVNAVIKKVPVLKTSALPMPRMPRFRLHR